MSDNKCWASGHFTNSTKSSSFNEDGVMANPLNVPTKIKMVYPADYIPTRGLRSSLAGFLRRSIVFGKVEFVHGFKKYDTLIVVPYSTNQVVVGQVNVIRKCLNEGKACYFVRFIKDDVQLIRMYDDDNGENISTLEVLDEEDALYYENINFQ